jgi:hypothetical protein
MQSRRILAHPAPASRSSLDCRDDLELTSQGVDVGNEVETCPIIEGRGRQGRASDISQGAEIQSKRLMAPKRKFGGRARSQLGSV